MKSLKLNLFILLIISTCILFTGCAHGDSKNVKNTAKEYIKAKYGIEAEAESVEFVSGIYYVSMNCSGKIFEVQIVVDNEKDITIDKCMDNYEYDIISDEIKSRICEIMGNKDIEVYSEYSKLGYYSNVLDSSIRSLDELLSRDDMFIECIVLGHGIDEEQVNRLSANMFYKAYNIGLYEWTEDSFPDDIGEMKKHDEIYAGHIPEFSPVIVHVQEEYSISDSEPTIHTVYKKVELDDAVFIANEDSELEVNVNKPSKSPDSSIANSFTDVSEWYEVKMKSESMVKILFKTDQDIEKLYVMRLDGETFTGEVANIKNTVMKHDYSVEYENNFEGTSWIKLVKLK